MKNKFGQAFYFAAIYWEHSTQTCEDVNISTVAELSSLKFLFGIYFSKAAVETLNCTGNPFDDKLIVGTLTTSEEKQIIHVSSVARLKKSLQRLVLNFGRMRKILKRSKQGGCGHTDYICKIQFMGLYLLTLALIKSKCR